MTNPFSNPSYLLPPLAALAVTIILLMVIWRKSRWDFSSRIFLLLIFSVGLWSFFVFGMRASPDTSHALPWGRAVIVPGFATWVFYFHFSAAVTNLGKQRGIILIAYSLLILAAILSPTDLVIRSMRVESYGYAPDTSTLGLFFFLAGFILIVLSVRNLLKRYKMSLSHEERNRLLYLSIAAVFPILGGGLDGFSNLPPAAIWTNLIFCIICSVAIVKYHLLDIRVVVRKSLAYALTSVLIAVPYAGMLIILNQVLRTRSEPWWVHAIIILLLAILLRPLYSLTQGFVDRLFYRDRYDYLMALERFSKETQNILDLKSLSSKMVELVSGALRVSSVFLVLSSEAKHGLIIASSTGVVSPPAGIVLKNSSPLVKWLELHGEIVSSEQFNVVPQLQSLSQKEKTTLEAMGAQLLVPIKTRGGRLSGILIIGEKLSQQSFSGQEMQLLATVSTQMAMVLENARLYDESQQEVAERKRAEEETQKFKIIADYAGYGVIIVNSRNKIVYVNEAYAQMSGYSPNELIGKHVFTIYPEEQKKKVGRLRKQLDRRGIYVGEEVGHKRKDGSIFPTLMTGTVVRDENGGILYREGTVIDITDRKKMEEQLQHSQVLASLGEMTAGISHEVNNPLASIILLSEVVLAGDMPKQTRRDVKVIKGEAKRAANIMRDLLTYSHRMQPRMRRVNMHGLIKKILDMRQYQEKVRNINVTSNFLKGPLYVNGDSAQLTQVIINLVVNAEAAVKETKEGKIIVTTRVDGERVKLSIADNGTGIPEENLNQIFNPFFTTRGVGKGTGLGLSTCYGIVTGHGGLIHAENNEMSGATFTVEIPLAGKGRQGILSLRPEEVAA